MHKIQIKETNNSKIIKFESNNFLVKNNTYEFNNIDEAKNSPLAQQLFYLPFVKKVYIANNFIAIERYDIVTWEDVSSEVATQIENYLNSNLDVVTTPQEPAKTPVTVYAESTPNPAVMRFVANKKITLHTLEFTSIDEAKNSPLATELFHFPFVKAVFIDSNYISITKYDIAEWNDITMELREFIKRFIESNKEVISVTARQEEAINTNTPNTGILDDISKEIIAILDEYVKPAVASDGGNIMFKSYLKESKTVEVVLQGACSGCPSSTLTLKNGIENILKQMMSGKVETVVATNG